MDGRLQPGNVHRLYELQLARQLTPPVARHVNRPQTLAMLRWMQIAWGIRLSADPARCWVWSDLHLNHRAILHHGRRPFATLERMREYLAAAWRERVEPADCIVCVGDLAIGGPSEGVDRWVGALPGCKIVVAGNHEFWAAREPPKRYGVAELMPTLLVDGGLPAVLTHEPLESVPDGYINIHGHLHGLARPVSNRHVNVNVEQTAYRPLRLSEVLRMSHAVAAGQATVAETTGESMERYLKGRPR